MAFLNPFLLLGLAAAAIPLVIHLFNFRKPKRIDFSSLAFLHELEKRTMRRVRLKQWLLLALRTLAIASLVVAFARPTRTNAWNGAFGERSPTAIAIVVDNSLSMLMRDVQGAYLDQAKSLATALIEGTQPGDELFLVATAQESDLDLMDFVSLEAAIDAIADLEARAGAQPVSAAISRAVSLLESASNPEREIYYISDLQSTTFPDSARTIVPESYELTLMPLGERAHSNTSVINVELTSRIIEFGRPIKLSAAIARFGDDLEGYGTSVFIEGERVAQTAVDLPERVPQELPFTFVPARRGWLSGEVRIEPDEAGWDDVRYFTIYVPDAQRVLIVRGTNARADHVAVALSVAAERGTLDVTQTDENNLATVGVDEFDAVVLVGPEDLSSGEVGLLERYVSYGGGLLLFAGDDPLALSELITSLSGGRFDGLVGEVGGPSLGGFGRADLEHPLFEGMFSSASDLARLESPEIFQAVRYVSAGADERSVIQLAGGTPFLQEIRHGQGSALVYTVAPDPRWSDYTVRGLFVPLLYRSVVYLSAADVGFNGSLSVGEAATFRVEGSSGSEPIRLTGQDGTEFTPTQRTVPGAILVDIDESISLPGIYDLRQGDTLLRRIAINLNPSESDLATLTTSDATNRLEAATGRPVRVLDASGGAGLVAAHSLRSAQSGVELANVFLALALAFLFTEMMVAMRWKPEGAALPG